MEGCAGGAWHVQGDDGLLPNSVGSLGFHPRTLTPKQTPGMQPFFSLGLCSPPLQKITTGCRGIIPIAMAFSTPRPRFKRPANHILDSQRLEASPKSNSSQPAPTRPAKPPQARPTRVSVPAQRIHHDNVPRDSSPAAPSPARPAPGATAEDRGGGGPAMWLPQRRPPANTAPSPTRRPIRRRRADRDSSERRDWKLR